RVGADPALPVVDERALVVRAQQDELPVELEQVRLREALDLAVRDACAVADYATEPTLGGKDLRHRVSILAVQCRAQAGGQDRVAPGEVVASRRRSLLVDAPT